MNWAVPIFVSLVIVAWFYLLFRRNLKLANEAQTKADVLTTAIEQSSAVVGITDLAGNLQYVNPAFEEASGYAAAELLGQNPRVLKSGVTPDEVYARMWQTITSGENWVGELCNKKKDGTLYWEWASISGVTDRSGKIQHFVKVAEDITSRKKAAAARAESDKRFRTIFDLAGAGMALLDRQGRWLKVNDRLCNILGRTGEDLQGRFFLEFTPAEDLDVDRDWFRRFEGQNQRSSSIEKRYLTPDGLVVWTEITATLVRDVLGAPEYYICLIKDVSRRRAAEDEAARQQTQLAHMARVHTLQQMASELAHEIDQPLCAILSASQASARLLDRGDAQAMDDVRDAVKIVAEQAERAGSVVQSIRQFSRKQSTDRKVFGLRQTVDQALNLLGPELRSHGVTVRVNPEGRDEPFVLGDPVLMAQVLVNLCRNGADAMMEKGADPRVLTLSWEYRQADLVIRVHNTGPAMAAEVVDRVFTPFFTTRPEGLGLGLSLSRSIIESFGGELGVEAEQTEGTTFFMVLPAQAQPSPEAK
jgi:nitrogen fixation negative regulator NifL